MYTVSWCSKKVLEINNMKPSEKKNVLTKIY